MLTGTYNIIEQKILSNHENRDKLEKKNWKEDEDKPLSTFCLLV